jgi:hypothetical protein
MLSFRWKDLLKVFGGGGYATDSGGQASETHNGSQYKNTPLVKLELNKSEQCLSAVDGVRR